MAMEDQRMRRYNLAVVAAFLCLVPSLARRAGVCAQAGNSPDIKATMAYVSKLQTPGGGFLPKKSAPDSPQKPSLRATSAAVRALHYLGGDIPNKAGASKFVASCFDRDS